jgi:toxin-antitoxin system PIN domain toxin
MFLPDVNFWLALAFESHVHHAPAKDWFDAVADASSSFCRMTQQGFLRLATNPKAFGAEAVSLSGAWGLYDAFAGDPRVTYAEEPAHIETFWRGHTQSGSFSPKVWNDAFLAAFAQAASLQLVTFDKGFAQFKGVNCAILS